MFTRILTSFGGYIIGSLAVIILFLGVSLHLTSNKLEDCKTSRATDKVMYEKAQAEAEVLWMKAVKDKEKEYEEKAKKADASFSELSAKYSDAVRVYVSKSKPKESGGTPQGTGTSSGDGSSQDPVLPDGFEFSHPELDATDVAVVPVSDLLICAENTARLVVARDWALGLNE